MPALLLGIPAAIVLAFVALKGRLPRRRDVESLAAGAGALVAGDTGELAAAASGDDPWKREELPTRERPSSSGGEVGGHYGPPTNDRPPLGEPDDEFSGYDVGIGPDGPLPTQTFVGSTLLGGSLAQRAASFTYVGDQVKAALPRPGAGGPAPYMPIMTPSGPLPQYVGSSAIAALRGSAPAPAPTPTGTYSVGSAKAV